MGTDTRRLADLRTDPANSAIFDPLEGQDLAELADSIKENGIINPITIRPDGSIIAGEQRYRAAGMAGLTEVPVVVLDVSDQQVEVLRIEENLRRRGLKPSETARAIRRLYELHGIVSGRHTSATPIPSSTVAVEEPPTKTAGDVARDAGMSATQASVYNRLADLIPELMQLRDAGTITQAVAYQLAQLPATEQAALVERLAPSELTEKEVQTLKKRVAELNDQIAWIQEQAGTAPANATEPDDAQAGRLADALRSLQEEKDAEIERLRTTKDTELAALTEKKDAAITELRTKHAMAAKWDKKDRLHGVLRELSLITMVPVEEYVAGLRNHEELSVFVENDRTSAQAAIAWLRTYVQLLSTPGNRTRPALGVVPSDKKERLQSDARR